MSNSKKRTKKATSTPSDVGATPTSTQAVTKGKRIARPVAAEPTPTTKTPRTPPVVQHGVQAPSRGRCRDVWDACAHYLMEHGVAPTKAHMDAHALQHGWNSNNTAIEYYRWKKFMGIAPTPKVAQAPTPAVEVAEAPTPTDT